MFSFMRAGSIIVAAVLLGMVAAGSPNALAASAPKIDFKRAYQAAQISSGVYQGRSAILGRILTLGLSGFIETPGSTDVQYGIVFNDKRRIQVIAVRGTVSRINFGLDLDTRGVRDEKTGILLHNGFKTAADSIYADVKPRLRRGYTTYLTGHSLGGAVAAILGIYLRHDKVKIGAIYTFGQPKFTDVAGAKAYRNLPLQRFIYQNDTVVLVPDVTKDNEQVYAHIGPAINLLSGPYYVYVSAERTLQISQGSFKKFFGLISLQDHHMRWYLDGLREKLGGATRVSFEDRNEYIVRHKPGYVGPWERKYNFNLPN